MKVTGSSYRPPSPAKRHQLPRTVLRPALLVLLVCLVAYLGVKIFVPNPSKQLRAWAIEHGHDYYQNTRLLKELTLVPKRLAQATETKPELVIDIKFKHMQKLYQKRAEALDKGILISSDDSLVPASIRHDNRTTKVKLRLKGDWTDHLESDKWSFRIHVRGKDHVLGMRRFSLQHPKVRGYQGEALFFETLRHVGVLAPRYFFVDVILNGNSLGIMALEEHFDKELLESNDRRESVIVRFDESLLWAARGSESEVPNFDDRVFHNYRNASIDAFRSSRIAKSQRLSKDYAIAVGLLRGFVNDQLSASDVFDTTLLGRFIAVVDFWGARHSIYWHNLRFYFNPLTAKLEPIGFDADLQNRTPPGTEVSQEEPIVSAMLEDSMVFDAYWKTLKQLAKEAMDGSLEKKLRNVEQRHLALLHKEFYLLETLPPTELRDRAKHLLALSEADLKTQTIPMASYPVIIRSYQQKDDTASYVEIFNSVPHVVEVQSISWVHDKGASPDLEFDPLPGTELPLKLPATPPEGSPEGRRIYYQPPPDSAAYSMQITAHIPGQRQLFTAKAEPYHSPLTEHPIPVSTARDQLARHPFLALDSENVALHVKPGKWLVQGSLIVPVGYSLTVTAGTTLQFGVEDGLFAHGPLHFAGTTDAPIVLEGIMSSVDEKNNWQGVAVLDVGVASQWAHVNVRNTTGIDRTNWQLTGGVTFYRSDVHLSHCRFEGNRAEDALNIVSSKFELDHVHFVDTLSDAFDADFTQGSVEGGLFEEIGKAGGGDAIDISASEVTVNRTHFRDISDKALSVGEQSTMVATDVTIEHVGTGAASKDGSSLEIRNSTIKQVENAGLMAYVKKPEFGHARIEASNINFVGQIAQARVQKGSAVILDGTQVESEDVDVEQLYETTMKAGLRR